MPRGQDAALCVATSVDTAAAATGAGFPATSGATYVATCSTYARKAALSASRPALGQRLGNRDACRDRAIPPRPGAGLPICLKWSKPRGFAA